MTTWACSMIEILRSGAGRIPFVELIDSKEQGIALDVRYARTDNFLSTRFYPQARVFLLSHVAEDVMRVCEDLRAQGRGLLIFDGYRPWSVTKQFWDRSSVGVREFLADPATGSAHNRACAVDLSLFDLATGLPIAMPSDFDEMNEKAWRDFQGGAEDARRERDRLRTAMEQHGFTGIPNEWWHFNHSSRHEWPVMDFGFEEIPPVPQNPRPLRSR